MWPQLRQGGKGALLPDERSNRVGRFYFYVTEGLTDADDCENYENSGLINQHVESRYNLARKMHAVHFGIIDTLLYPERTR